MKIAILNNLYKPFERGGAERVVEIQRTLLLELGHEVTIISLCPKNEKPEPKDGFRYIESLFFDLGKTPLYKRFFWHLNDTLNIFKARKVMRTLGELEVDLVLTHNLTGLGKISAYLIAKKYRHWHYLHDINLLHPSGLVFWGKEEIINTFLSRAYQTLTASFFTNTELVISPSSWLLDMHIKKGLFVGTRHREVWETPIEVTGENKAPQSENERLKFLYVGLLSEHKGIDLLLEAWEDLKKAGELNKADLYLVGSLEKKEYQTEIEKMRDVKYFGKMARAELDEIYRESDCLIVPSLCYENSPTVIYEAVAKSLCVISTGHGGAGELAQKIDAISFQAGSVESLQESMLWAYDNPKLVKKIGEQSRRAISDYNYKHYQDRMKRFLNLSHEVGD